MAFLDDLKKAVEQQRSVLAEQIKTNGTPTNNLFPPVNTNYTPLNQTPQTNTSDNTLNQNVLRALLGQSTTPQVSTPQTDIPRDTSYPPVGSYTNTQEDVDIYSLDDDSLLDYFTSQMSGVGMPNLTGYGQGIENVYSNLKTSIDPTRQQILDIISATAQQKANETKVNDTIRDYLAQRYGGYKNLLEQRASATTEALGSREKALADIANRMRTTEGFISPQALASAQTASAPTIEGAEVLTGAVNNLLGLPENQIALGLQAYQNQLAGNEMLANALSQDIGYESGIADALANAINTTAGLAQGDYENALNRASTATDLRSADLQTRLALQEANKVAQEQYGGVVNPVISGLLLNPVEYVNGSTAGMTIDFSKTSADPNINILVEKARTQGIGTLSAQEKQVVLSDPSVIKQVSVADFAPYAQAKGLSGDYVNEALGYLENYYKAGAEANEIALETGKSEWGQMSNVLKNKITEIDKSKYKDLFSSSGDALREKVQNLEEFKNINAFADKETDRRVYVIPKSDLPSTPTIASFDGMEIPLDVSYDAYFEKEKMSKLSQDWLTPSTGKEEVEPHARIVINNPYLGELVKTGSNVPILSSLNKDNWKKVVDGNNILYVYDFGSDYNSFKNTLAQLRDYSLTQSK